MDYQFKTCYLVCFDCSEDVNYVIHRTKDLAKARRIAKLAKRKNPDSNIYITIEKVCDDVVADAANICGCGQTTGVCIGDLGCRCNPYAICKLTDTKRNPLDPYEKYEDDDEDDEDYDDYEDYDEDEDEDEDDVEENPYLQSAHGLSLEYDYAKPVNRYNPVEVEYEEEEGEDEEEGAQASDFGIPIKNPYPMDIYPNYGDDDEEDDD